MWNINVKMVVSNYREKKQNNQLQEFEVDACVEWELEMSWGRDWSEFFVISLLVLSQILKLYVYI